MQENKLAEYMPSLAQCWADYAVISYQLSVISYQSSKPEFGVQTFRFGNRPNLNLESKPLGLAIVQTNVWQNSETRPPVIDLFFDRFLDERFFRPF
ncbi:MAG: hypothetical protein B6247_10375 [Candidatus Parabeggiatoa sp. nov. 2]|nr:MAG: hypothetical protein B6247_10375 [Beggiatoa sp. 4572_84]